jgi:hypothetical protein
MLKSLTPNQTNLVSVDKLNSFLVRSRRMIQTLLQKIKSKSIGQLIYLVISKIKEFKLTANGLIL